MKKGLFAFSLVALFMIASCAIGQNQSDPNGPGSVDTLEAELHAPSETALVESVTIEVMVTYGAEPVTDANRVTVEIWKNGERDEGRSLPAVETDPGVYALETSFREDGIYHIQASVEAGSEEIEPVVVRMIAGDVSETELEAAEQEFQQEEDQEKAQESNSN